MTTKTLDLGCGSTPRNPFFADELFGVDVREGLGPNIRAADLVIGPIPYEDEAFDYLTAFDFIEHVPRVVYAPQRRNAFVELMNEAYRILKPGGYFMSSTPAYPHAEAFWDPTHVNVITEQTIPLYFSDQNRWAAIYGYTGAFRIVRHEWHGPHIHAVLRKVPVPPDPAAVPGTRISVLLPVYDDAALLERTLDSLLVQTHADFELLCIDDGSLGASAEILRRYAAQDARIRLLDTPARLANLAAVLNHGLRHAGGDHIVQIAQGDIFTPDWLQQMHARAVETRADAVLSDVMVRSAQGPELNRDYRGLDGDREVELSGRDALLHSLDWAISSHALWRAGLVKFFGFPEFDPGAREYAVRALLLNANKVVFSRGTLVREESKGLLEAAIGPHTFAVPYALLRLYQLLHTEMYPADVLERHAIRAVMMRNELRQWLNEHGAVHLTADELRQAGSLLEQATAGMKRDPMFSVVA